MMIDDLRMDRGHAALDRRIDVMPRRHCGLRRVRQGHVEEPRPRQSHQQSKHERARRTDMNRPAARPHPGQRRPDHGPNHGLTITPHGSRPTGTDFSGFWLAASITVMSFVRPLTT